MNPSLPAGFTPHKIYSPYYYVRQVCTQLWGHDSPTWQDLLQRLAEPQRHYHTAAHVETVLTWLVTADYEPLFSLCVAALFHDAVYDPRRNDNEAKSASLCRVACAKTEMPLDEIDEAARLILLTKTHDPTPDDCNGVLLTCADLWVLGGEPDEYETYRRQVRAEYAHVSDEQWRQGRPRVLRHFLDRERIYPAALLPLMRRSLDIDAREATARRNLQNEIDELEQTL